MGSLAATARPDAPASGRFVMVPKGPRSIPRSRRELVVRRRRAAFERLLVVAAATFLIALVPGLRAFFWAHLAADAALVGFGIWLRTERERDRALKRSRLLTEREDERRARLVRQEQLVAEQDHIDAALASTQPDEAPLFGRASGGDA